MLQKCRVPVAVLAICLTLGSGTAAAGEITLEGEYWNPRINGEIKSAAAVDVKNDLGMGNKSIMTGELGFKGERGPKYFVRYESPSFRSTGNLARALSLNGGSYASGDRFVSNIDVSHFQFGIQNEKETSHAKFSVIYSYNHNSIRTSIQDITRNISTSKKDTSDSLSVGFSWESLKPKGINFFAEATPLSIGSQGGYLDYNVGLKTKLGKVLTLTLGYRGEKLEAGKTSSSVGSELQLKGWYVFLGAGF